MNHDSFFNLIEEYAAPSSILFRSIELKVVKHYMPPIAKKSVSIDIGCGDGLSSRILFGKTVTCGLDNDPAELEKARQHNTFQHYICANASSIPLKNTSVDFVFSNSVIEHIPDIHRVLSEISRITKTGGTFLFTSPSDNFVTYSLFSQFGLDRISSLYRNWRQRKFNHYNCLSATAWKSLLKRYNFSVVKSYYYIDQDTAELWDILLVTNWLLEQISRTFARICYQHIFRSMIYKRYTLSHVTGPTGASVCIIAKKI